MFQIKVALYEGNNFIACAATGAGKTLTFWILLLITLGDGMKDLTVIIVTPLWKCRVVYSCHFHFSLNSFALSFYYDTCYFYFYYVFYATKDYQELFNMC